MNHNFCDYELTKLLGNNPYYDNQIRFYWSIPKGGNDKNPVLLSAKNDTSITAWTWEDVRLYLESKGFEIYFYRQTPKSQYYWHIYKVNVKWYLNEDCNKIYIVYDTYEEARFEAIKYCLNLIKQY
jgi:hypothetical protein